MKTAAIWTGLLAVAAASNCKRSQTSVPTTAATVKTSMTTSTKATTTNTQKPCNADNCARAVTGTFQGLATQNAHKSDCSSFFQCTSYPATVTVPVTVTAQPILQSVTVIEGTVTKTLISLVVETVTAAAAPVRRDITSLVGGSVVCPSAVPTYASACSGTAGYSSACSCFGVTMRTSTATTPTISVTATVSPTSTVVVPETATVTQNLVATTLVTVAAPQATGNAYCENGQPVNGLSAPCTAVGCSTTNLRIEGSSGTIYEGTILAGPRNITTASGGTHLCDGTNNNANTTPFNNGISTIAAAGGLCNFDFDGTFSTEFNDFFIETIGDTTEGDGHFWGILLNYEFTAAGGCETEVHSTDELLWAFNAFDVNYFLRVEPTQTPVVLAPGQSTTFTVQGTDGNGDPFVNIAGATFNGQTSDGNGNVPFTAPTTPGTYRYKATLPDSIRSNAVTVIVQG